MSIVTISRGSYSRGKEIAEKVAERMGYKCISRDVLLDTSDKFHIPEIKLIRAIHDAPSILDRFVYSKDKYVNFIQTTLLKHLQQDNIVYHGLAGHFFVKEVPHVLKVRIISDLEDRIRCEMDRESISYDEARQILVKDDEQRKKWSLHLYGIDTSESSLYDLVIHISKITVDDAADLICHTLEQGRFKTTPESQNLINDLALAAEVKATVFHITPNIEVFADHGDIRIKAKTHEMQGDKLVSDMKAKASSVEGVSHVDIETEQSEMYTD